MAATTLLLAGLVILVAYVFNRVRYTRLHEYSKLPQLKPSLVWGHMKLFNDYILRSRPNAHVDEAFILMAKELGNPPILFCDMRPASWPMVLIGTHEIAERVTRATRTFPWSVPKSPTMRTLKVLMGEQSLLTKNGEEWKHLRKMFNPGFAPSHLLSLLPAILDKTSIFLKHLDDLVKSGNEFSMSELTVNLTFDIIGAVIMGVDFDAQHANKADRGELINLYDELVHTYDDERGDLPWWFTPRLTWRRQHLANEVAKRIKPVIREEFARQQQGKSSAKENRSVLALSLRDYKTLTKQNVEEACDQIKTFLFAGHDTTSILLGWIFYELSLSPGALKAVRQELDSLFGSDPSPASVYEKLLAPGGEDLVGRMPYCSAVIKEALRLHPPAGTARMSPPGTGLMLATGTGEEVCVDGFVLYITPNLVQRDRNVYGETADDFIPERWLGNSDTSEQTNNDSTDEKDSHAIPAGAWRPFERGPRNCIGQELANIEARVIMAVIARQYDFVKVGLGELDLDEKGKPVLDGKGRYKVKSELYNTMQVTAKPVDGMIMKVKLTSRTSA